MWLFPFSINCKFVCLFCYILCGPKCYRHHSILLYDFLATALLQILQGNLINRHIFDRMIEVLYNQKEIASKVRLNISSIHCSFVNCTCLSNLRCTVSKYYKLFFLPYQDLGKRKFYFYLFSLFF